MGYHMNAGSWNSVFAVPSCVVDNEIRLAGAVQLKVLLWILRNNGADFKAEDISAAIGVSAPDVADAIQYWCIRGLLVQEEETPAKEPMPLDDPFTPSAVSEKKEEPLLPKRTPRPDHTFVTKRMEESSELAFLMQEAQVILGKTISPGLSSVLIMIHDDYGLPADVILMILQYAKMKGKDHTGYIEAMGKNWAEESILTHDLAEEKLKKLDEAEKAWHKLRRILRIDKRSPSRKEENFAETWILNWNFHEEMIKEAYDRCIDSTGKMSLSYMNKILEKWHEKGIITLAQAQQEYSKGKKGSAKEKKRSTTYDLDEFESLLSDFQPVK